MDLRIDRVDDAAQVLLIGMEGVVVHVHDQQTSLVVLADPRFVALVQAAQVVDADARFVLTAAFGDLLHQVRHAGAEVDEQVGRSDRAVHVLEQAEVVLEVPRGHQPHGVEVGGEDVRVLVDRAVLHHVPSIAADLQQLLEAAVQEEDLEVEAPALHVLVEVEQVGVVVHRLLQQFPLVVLGEELGERRLARSDVSGDRDVHGPCRANAHEVSRTTGSGRRVWKSRSAQGSTTRMIRMRSGVRRYRRPRSMRASSTVCPSGMGRGSMANERRSYRCSTPSWKK